MCSSNCWKVLVILFICINQGFPQLELPDDDTGDQENQINGNPGNQRDGPWYYKTGNTSFRVNIPPEDLAAAKEYLQQIEYDTETTNSSQTYTKEQNSLTTKTISKLIFNPTRSQQQHTNKIGVILTRSKPFVKPTRSQQQHTSMIDLFPTRSKSIYAVGALKSSSYTSDKVDTTAAYDYEESQQQHTSMLDPFSTRYKFIYKPTRSHSTDSGIISTRSKPTRIKQQHASKLELIPTRSKSILTLRPSKPGRRDFEPKTGNVKTTNSLYKYSETTGAVADEYVDSTTSIQYRSNDITVGALKSSSYTSDKVDTTAAYDYEASQQQHSSMLDPFSTRSKFIYKPTRSHSTDSGIISTRSKPTRIKQQHASKLELIPTRSKPILTLRPSEPGRRDFEHKTSNVKTTNSLYKYSETTGAVADEYVDSTTSIQYRSNDITVGALKSSSYTSDKVDTTAAYDYEASQQQHSSMLDPFSTRSKFIYKPTRSHSTDSGIISTRSKPTRIKQQHASKLELIPTRSKPILTLRPSKPGRRDFEPKTGNDKMTSSLYEYSETTAAVADEYVDSTTSIPYRSNDITVGAHKSSSYTSVKIDTTAAYDYEESQQQHISTTSIPYRSNDIIVGAHKSSSYTSDKVDTTAAYDYEESQQQHTRMLDPFLTRSKFIYKPTRSHKTESGIISSRSKPTRIKQQHASKLELIPTRSKPILTLTPSKPGRRDFESKTGNDKMTSSLYEYSETTAAVADEYVDSTTSIPYRSNDITVGAHESSSYTSVKIHTTAAYDYEESQQQHISTTSIPYRSNDIIVGAHKSSSYTSDKVDTTAAYDYEESQQQHISTTSIPYRSNDIIVGAHKSSSYTSDKVDTTAAYDYEESQQQHTRMLDPLSTRSKFIYKPTRSKKTESGIILSHSKPTRIKQQHASKLELIPTRSKPILTLRPSKPGRRDFETKTGNDKTTNSLYEYSETNAAVADEYVDSTTSISYRSNDITVGAHESSSYTSVKIDTTAAYDYEESQQQHISTTSIPYRSDDITVGAPKSSSHTSDKVDTTAAYDYEESQQQHRSTTSIPYRSDDITAGAHKSSSYTSDKVDTTAAYDYEESQQQYTSMLDLFSTRSKSIYKPTRSHSTDSGIISTRSKPAQIKEQLTSKLDLISTRSKKIYTSTPSKPGRRDFETKTANDKTTNSLYEYSETTATVAYEYIDSTTIIPYISNDTTVGARKSSSYTSDKVDTRTPYDYEERDKSTPYGSDRTTTVPYEYAETIITTSHELDKTTTSPSYDDYKTAIDDYLETTTLQFTPLHYDDEPINFRSHDDVTVRLKGATIMTTENVDTIASTSSERQNETTANKGTSLEDKSTSYLYIEDEPTTQLKTTVEESPMVKFRANIMSDFTPSKSIATDYYNYETLPLLTSIEPTLTSEINKSLTRTNATNKNVSQTKTSERQKIPTRSSNSNLINLNVIFSPTLTSKKSYAKFLTSAETKVDKLTKSKLYFLKLDNKQPTLGSKYIYFPSKTTHRYTLTPDIAVGQKIFETNTYPILTKYEENTETGVDQTSTITSRNAESKTISHEEYTWLSEEKITPLVHGGLSTYPDFLITQNDDYITGNNFTNIEYIHDADYKVTTQEYQDFVTPLISTIMPLTIDFLATKYDYTIPDTTVANIYKYSVLTTTPHTQIKLVDKVQQQQNIQKSQQKLMFRLQQTEMGTTTKNTNVTESPMVKKNTKPGKRIYKGKKKKVEGNKSIHQQLIDILRDAQDSEWEYETSTTTITTTPRDIYVDYVSTTTMTTVTLPECKPPTTTVTTTTTGTTPTTTTTKIPLFDLKELMSLIANLTFDYETNITHHINESLQKYSIPTCKTFAKPTTISMTPPTSSTTAPPYYPGPASGYALIVSKCFVCGLDEPGIPYDANCADAFAGDFLPLVPVDPTARGKLSKFRKYCRFKDIHGVYHNATDPRSVFGRWTGGCAVRWNDISGVYTQRTCRNRYRAIVGKHFASKRMAKLEMALSGVDNGCIASPSASLIPLSRGISLFAKFHACVCSGNWCNNSSRLRHNKMLLYIIFIFINARCEIIYG